MRNPTLLNTQDAGIANGDRIELATSDWVAICEVPCDHIPARSWPLFRTREVLHGVIESIQREQTT
jgi:hypothetical protein